MLTSLVQFSLRYRSVVAALACLVIGYGTYVASHTKLDVFPEFAPPMIVVQTESPGLSAEQVEQLVTRPIENELNGSPSLESIRSQSIQGLSAITLVFDQDADIYRVRQLVGERLAEVAGELPQGVQPPKMGPLTSSTGLFLVLGLTSTNRTQMDLRTFADWTLRPRLLGVPGVSRVDIFGGDRRQLQVRVKPDRLAAYDLALTDVLEAARQATGVRGAGFIENANQRIIIRSEGQALTPEQLGQAVLRAHPHLSLRLSDVAEVTEGGEPRFGEALIMGRPGVILLAWSQFGQNTLEVTAAVEAALEEMQLLFAAEHVELHPRLFRPATFIEDALRNVSQSLWLGGALVAAVLFFFLLDVRTAFISFVSIPLSLLAAVIVLDRWGVSINTITLGGFAISIGVVVDDAIIDVENILRRVRENLARPAPRPLVAVVLEASLEVRSAVVYATFIVALVFLPVLMMSGVEGRMFAPLARAFILAILASLVVALTVTPALCVIFLSRSRPRAEPPYVRWLKERHQRWLAGISRHPKTVLGAVAALCLGALATVPFFGGEFLPEFQEGHLLIHMAAVPGTSLTESLRLGRSVTEGLLRHPKVQSVSQQVGRAENGEDTWGPHLSEFHVELKPLQGEESEWVVAEIRDILLQFPGLTFKVMPFLAERMEETISGATAQLVINLFGEDLDRLDERAEAVRNVLEQTSGAVDVQVEAASGLPEMAVRLRPESLARYGFQPGEVLEALQTAYQGTVVAQTFEGNRVHDVAVILDEASRKDPEGLAGLLLRNRLGQPVPLSELAEVSLTSGRYVVVREGAQRRQQISCNVEGRDLASFVREVKQRVATQVQFPQGVYAAYGGSAEAQARARRELLIHSLLAAIGIVLLLAVVFRTGRNLLLILANLPFALVGGVLAVFATGGLLSIGTLVGFVTLFGITMRNSIMLVSHYEHLVQSEGMIWDTVAALRGASERLVPILMTALVTGLGVLPLAWGAGEAGREIEGPMAIVILGGLLTSTALNLLVLPTLALRFGRFVPASKLTE